MLTQVIAAAPLLFVMVKSDVRIKEINFALIEACQVFCAVFSEYGVVPVITGGSEPRTPDEPDHDMGMAWDWRSRDLASPQEVLGKLRTAFAKIDPHFYVIYDTGGTAPHFHCSYKLTLEPNS